MSKKRSTYRDFEEIAHCGGKITFRVEKDENGEISGTLGFSGSSPNAMSLAGVYAAPVLGIPVGNYMLGWTSTDPDRPAPSESLIPVMIGSDTFGHFPGECPICSEHFRSSSHPATYPMTCPYCGVRAQSFNFLTSAQRKFIKYYVEIFENMQRVDMSGQDFVEQVIDFEEARKNVNLEELPEFYYGSRRQQTEFKCEKCDSYNDIRGVFGYCAQCGWRNNLQYFKLKQEEIRGKLVSGDLEVSGAISKIVSLFDSCCKDFTRQLYTRVPMRREVRKKFDRGRFHSIDSRVIESLELVFGIKLFEKYSEKRKLSIAEMLGIRHVFEHNEGVADEKFCESVDSKFQIGDLIRLESEGFIEKIGDFQKAIENFEQGFHELFPPESEPVGYKEERLKRMRER